MLKTLENRDQKEVERLLALTAERLLPYPGTEPKDEENRETQDIEDKIIEEIQSKLNIDVNDKSPEVKAKLFDFIYNEMSISIKSETRREQAKARLEQKGYIQPSTYRIIFKDSFREEEKRGIRRSHVDEVIRSPDKVQHLKADIYRRENFPEISIYTKIISSRQQGDLFTLLVITQREGNTQSVLSAWRVYHSDVAVSDMNEPLGVLRTFVDAYGISFQVGNSPLAKFFLYEVFLMKPGQQPTNIISFDNRNGEYYSSMLIRISDLQAIEVALAYIINVSSYISDLRKHNQDNALRADYSS